MITAIVQVRLPSGVTREQAVEAFRASAPHYLGKPGLVRTYYLFNEGETAGAVFVWESREAAEAALDAAWRQSIAERYGVAPQVTFFDSPVVVDNVSDEIIED